MGNYTKNDAEIKKMLERIKKKDDLNLKDVLKFFGKSAKILETKKIKTLLELPKIMEYVSEGFYMIKNEGVIGCLTELNGEEYYKINRVDTAEFFDKCKKIHNIDEYKKILEELDFKPTAAYHFQLFNFKSKRYNYTPFTYFLQGEIKDANIVLHDPYISILEDVYGKVMTLLLKSKKEKKFWEFYRSERNYLSPKELQEFLPNLTHGARISTGKDISHSEKRIFDPTLADITNKIYKRIKEFEEKEGRR